ncbi:MAG: sensor histidine kinase [Candidatus Howiella sp.]|jgi:hypothetical protein
MKKTSRWICSFIFLLLCLAVFWFLRLFMATGESAIYINWQSSVQIASDGTEIPYEPGDDPTNVPESGNTYRFSAILPEGLENGYLQFETSGLELTLYLNGTEIHHSAGVPPEGVVNMSQAHLPLPENAAGELTASCTIMDPANAMFPPLIRFIPERLQWAEPMSIANTFGIPAGFTAAALLLSAGLFLLSILRKRPEWSLIPLSLALTGLTVYRLVQNCGYYFLPEAAVQILSWEGFAWLAPLALAVYLVMNSRRKFWKLLGWAAAWSAAALLTGYLISLACGGAFAELINLLVQMLINGIYETLLYWFTLWLSGVCALISAYWMMRSLVRQKTEAQMLEVKNRLIVDSYHAIERKMRDSAGLRHEMRHQIAALDALYQQKDFDQLGRLLGEWKRQDALLAQTRFTENFIVNAILQDAASRSAEAGTVLEAQVHLPEKLSIPESDLCTLLMNMLDNALEASAGVEKPEERAIRFKAEIRSGFLAVKCENRYAGNLEENAQGQLRTQKSQEDTHGFGLRQMSAIAEKYHSVLDISYTEEQLFIVQTALKLPREKQT